MPQIADEPHFMDSKNRLDHIIHCLVEYRKLWLLPAIAGVVLATVYAFFIQGETWTSRQTMIIRDDLIGNTFKPGQFLSEEALKSAQETVLETARRPEVVRAVLEKLGPDRKSLFGLSGVPSDWPSRDVIEDCRAAVSFESANGGEFGKSEVIVLAAKSSSPDRASKFLTILTEEIDSKLAVIRANRFESMEAELNAIRESAHLTRNELAERIKEMDASFGTDISIVQSMNDNSGGNPSAFDNKLNEIRLKRRTAIGEISSLRSFKTWLEEASKSSSLELPTSKELLDSQPSLSALVTGLATAKSELSEAEGKYNAPHGRVRNAKAKVASMKRQIQQAIPATIRGLDGQIAVLTDSVRVLDQMMAENAELLTEISAKRVPYASLAGELKKQTENYVDASGRLAQVQSRKNASSSIQLLTRIGEPWVGTRADGLGKRALSLVGGIAGLIVGLGLVMIAAPPFVDPNPDLAAAAEAGNGQRQPDAPTDQSGSHRLGDYAAASKAEPTNNRTAEQSKQSPPVPAPAVAMQTPPTPAPSTNSAPTVPEPVQVQTPIAPAPTAPTVPTPTPKPVVAESTPAPVSEIEALAAGVTAASMATAAATDTHVVPEVPAAYPAAAEPVVVQQRQTPIATPPIPQPASKTLAAIFANMPQPRIDATTLLGTADADAESANASQAIDNKIDALTDELRNSVSIPAPESREGRVESETIQLTGGELTSQEAIPLQRRAAVRPVNLARMEEKTEPNPPESADLSRENIDSAFSELDSTRPESPIAREMQSSDIENIFREED